MQTLMAVVVMALVCAAGAEQHATAGRSRPDAVALSTPNGEPCEMSGATEAVLVDGRCTALACRESLVVAAGLCISNVNSDADKGLSLTPAAVALAVFFLVALIALVVLLVVCLCGKCAAQPQSEDDAAATKTEPYPACAEEAV